MTIRCHRHSLTEDLPCTVDRCKRRLACPPEFRTDRFSCAVSIGTVSTGTVSIVSTGTVSIGTVSIDVTMTHLFFRVQPLFLEAKALNFVEV